MKAWISTVLIVFTVFGSASGAQAKSISRIIAEMGLSPEDFQVVSDASDALLKSGTPSVGKERAWSNESTGSKGTVRIRDVRQNCAHLQHFVQPAGADASREIRTRRCRDANGNWILTP
ncbi:MAG: hypothetical protein ACR2O2_07155 [Ruegeria sp.]